MEYKFWERKSTDEMVFVGKVLNKKQVANGPSNARIDKIMSN